MKKLIVIGLFALVGCAYTPEMAASLTNDQLCETYQNFHTEAEIAKRGINCDPFFRYCAKSGYEVGSEAFLTCQTALIQAKAQQNAAVYSNWGNNTQKAPILDPNLFFPEKVETKCTTLGNTVRCVSEDRNHIYRQTAQ